MFTGSDDGSLRLGDKIGKRDEGIRGREKRGKKGGRGNGGRSSHEGGVKRQEKVIANGGRP